MKKDPRVSVQMAVYNGEQYLREAIASILNQTFAAFELIIIDDASTDNTWQVLQDCAANESRISLLRNEINLGVAQARNRVLEIVRGEYIAVMDADDISLPGRLAAQVSFLDTFPEIGLIGCAVQAIDAHGVSMGSHHHATTHGLLLWGLCFTTPFAHPTVMFRRSVVERVGGYDGRLTANLDRDLYQRLSSITRFANLPDVYLQYRRHENTISNRHAEIQARNSAKAGQRMMSEILGYEVSFEICHNIRLDRFRTADDAIGVACLIRPLYDAFVSKQTLSPLEKRLIRKDAATRLFNLAWMWKREPRMREFFLEATQFDPFVSARVLWAKARWKLVMTKRVRYS